MDTTGRSMPPDGSSWEGLVVVDRLHDGLAERVCSGPQVLELRGSKIASMASGAPAPGVPTLDLRGLTVLPPLVEPHGHLHLAPWPLAPHARPHPCSQAHELEVADALTRAETAFRCGIGLFRDLGDPAGYNLAARRAAEDPAAPLPRILAAGAAIHRAGRYGRYLGEGIREASEIGGAVRRRLETDRVDVIKLIPTGIIDFEAGRVTAPPQLEKDELAEAVRLAHLGERRTCAHASGAAGIRRAVAAGVDFIEHGYFVEEDVLRTMADRGTVWTPTLAPVHVQWANAEECGWSAGVAAGMRHILDEHGERILLARKLGVRLLAGSDAGAAGVEQGSGLVLELELLEALGIPTLELLHWATRDAALVLGAAELGRIAAGRFASFIAVDGRPDERIGDLRNTVLHLREGRLFHEHHARAARRQAG